MAHSYAGKRVLIVTYYYPPLNWIQSYRAYSWVNFLIASGADVMVFTRQWQSTDKDMIADCPANNQPPQLTKPGKNALVWRYPFSKNNFLLKWTKPLMKITGVAGALNQLFLKLGYHTFERNFSIGNFSHMLEQAGDFKPDMVVATAPTHNLMPFASKIAKHCGAKFVMDFRDTWDNFTLLSQRPTTRQKNSFSNNWMRKSLTKPANAATLLTAISEGMRQVLQEQLSPAKSIVITNGYERSLFQDYRKLLPQPRLPLVISYGGSLYEQQLDPEWMTAFRRLAEQHPEGSVRFQFIGSTVFQKTVDVLRAELPAYSLEVTNRIPRDELLKKTAQSHILFYPGWKGYTGVLSGKIFEYLGLHRHILLAPPDGNDLEALIKETKAGWTLETADEILEVLNAFYRELEQGKLPPYPGDLKLVESYSREAQADKLFSSVLFPSDQVG